MWRRLAKEMGFDDAVFKMTDSELCAAYINWDDPKMGGVDMDYFKENGYLQDRRRLVRYARAACRTASSRRRPARSKCCCPITRTSSRDRSARCTRASRTVRLSIRCPLTIAPRESPVTNPELARRYPLNIISPKSHGFLNSCYANEPHKIRGQGEQFVMISPADAETRNIREGDPVRVANDRGAFEGVARVTDDVNPGIVVATLGYWRSLNRSDGSVNSISSDAWSGLGRAPTYSDNLVEVTRVN